MAERVFEILFCTALTENGFLFVVGTIEPRIQWLYVNIIHQKIRSPDIKAYSNSVTWCFQKIKIIIINTQYASIERMYDKRMETLENFVNCCFAQNV